MPAEKFRDMTPDQLDDELVKLKKEQFNLRFQAASGQLENTARVRVVRRTVFLNSGCVNRRSTSTTMVLSFLSDTTTPCKTRFGICCYLS